MLRSLVKSFFWYTWYSKRISNITWTSKSFVSWFYSKFAESFSIPEVVFMNLGYSDLNSESNILILNEEDELDRLSIQLYHHVINDITLKGLDVLEIGCGRGGGSSYIMRYLHPNYLTAVDLSSKAIDLCRISNKTDRINFQCADAESLPFPDNSFDIVVNIESSFCYPSMIGNKRKQSLFLSEVERILKPGGYFLFADLRLSIKEMDLLHERLNRSGLNILESENITLNVLKARELASESPYIDRAYQWCELVPSRKIAFFKSFIVAFVWNCYQASYYLKGSISYELMREGKMPYWRWIMQKDW